MFIGNAVLDSQSEHSDSEVFILSYNIQEQHSDKVRTLSQFITNACQVTATGYGPYDNGHLLLGLDDGSLMGFDVNGNFELVFQIQLC